METIEGIIWAAEHGALASVEEVTRMRDYVHALRAAIDRAENITRELFCDVIAKSQTQSLPKAALPSSPHITILKRPPMPPVQRAFVPIKAMQGKYSALATVIEHASDDAPCGTLLYVKENESFAWKFGNAFPERDVRTKNRIVYYGSPSKTSVSSRRADFDQMSISTFGDGCARMQEPQHYARLAHQLIHLAIIMNSTASFSSSLAPLGSERR
jgi:hypothetical protein